MGGNGSGRYQSARAKAVVEDAIKLNIFKLAREGIIFWENPESHSGYLNAADDGTMYFTMKNNIFTVSYKICSGEHKGEIVEQNIHITRTECNFGGYRYWWICPGCHQRCGKLYMIHAHKGFFCRKCANLTYQSCRMMTEKRKQEHFRATMRGHKRFLERQGWNE